jgi:hypothetical protein
MGLEPTPGPWQGPVLPLYYDRPGTEKLYHVTFSAARSFVRRGIHLRRHTHGAPASYRVNPALCGLADLKHARCLDDWRLPLPLGKLGSFGAVGINTGESLTVFVENCNLPVFMLAPSVLSQLGAFSFFQWLYPQPYYLNCNEAAQVPIRAILLKQRESRERLRPFYWCSSERSRHQTTFALRTTVAVPKWCSVELRPPRL